MKGFCRWRRERERSGRTPCHAQPRAAVYSRRARRAWQGRIRPVAFRERSELDVPRRPAVCCRARPFNDLAGLPSPACSRRHPYCFRQHDSTDFGAGERVRERGPDPEARFPAFALRTATDRRQAAERRTTRCPLLEFFPSTAHAVCTVRCSPRRYVHSTMALCRHTAPELQNEFGTCLVRSRARR